MTYSLWKFLYENDVESFRQYLAGATYIHGASKGVNATPSSPAFRIGSPSSLGTSPKTPKQKKSNQLATSLGGATRNQGLQLSRADINKRDTLGRTILHHAASLKDHHAIEFVNALLQVPVLDLYVQDAENGWTALHRALYFGNIDVAHALMRKDNQNVADFVSTATLSYLGGLVKIKDHEGNSPFEVFASTIAPRSLRDLAGTGLLDAADSDSVQSAELADEERGRDSMVQLFTSKDGFGGDEVYAFGSNKNLNLGLGDEDDRQFPEKIHLARPHHLLQRLYEDYLAEKQKKIPSEDLATSTLLSPAPEIPAMVKYQPIVVRDVVMSKMHTAILTTDPISNLHICGFGPGGRLGTGDENTRFSYVCIQGGGLARRHVSAIALGQYHTIALCSLGEAFTWGSNQYGQLGYVLPETSSKDIPMQLIPRQLYGLVKKEQIIGVAASSIHSVIYSATGMYTFGKNEGQLGLVDADARSLPIQVLPRRVGTSILQSPISSVSAIDRATSVLMENNDVIVFTQYAWKRVVFPLEEAPTNLFTQAFQTSYTKKPNSISKITSGGNTICAVSKFGQVFTIEVPKEAEHIAPNVSTTNPHRAKNALPQPARVWAIGKPHMSATDAAVGQDGSIILCTVSGSVWRKEKRAKIKSIHHRIGEREAIKDYKFVRVHNLTGAVAVKSNAFGAFTVIRKDIDVTRQQLSADPPSIWNDLFPLLPFAQYGSTGTDASNSAAEPALRFWVPRVVRSSPALIKRTLLENRDSEADFASLFKRSESMPDSPYDIWVSSTVTNVQIPMHSFLLKARSRVLRSALADMERSYYFSVPNVLSLEYDSNGCVELKLQDADFLTMVNFVFYMYTENLVDVWHHTSKALHLAPRYRQVRAEIMKIAAALELRQLERAARVMIDPTPSLKCDLEIAYLDLNFWTHADIIIDLADGAETPAHSALLCARCPFFEGLFNGRAGGLWMASRKGSQPIVEEVARIDLKHVEENIFLLVLRHIYADTGEELFDEISTNSLDDFIDLVIEVMSVGNELMLDRLAQICQKILGRYVTSRNVCGLLNTVAECSTTNFKDAALEYICLNLESMLGQRLLDELDDYLLEELSEVAQNNQLCFSPFSRSGRAEEELLEHHPELVEVIERDISRRIDSMRLPTRYAQENEHSTPKRRSNQTEEELPFAMDEDNTVSSPRLRSKQLSPEIRPMLEPRRSSNLSLSTSLEPIEAAFADSVTTDQSSVLIASPPMEHGLGKFELPTAAWKTSPLQDARIDFRSIMDQTNGSRISNLTQQMAAAAKPPPPVSATKMSQKERKRQQHDLKRQDRASTEAVEPNASAPKSPWSKVSSLLHRSVSSPLSAIESPTTSRSPPQTTRPGMTVRQTVSGAPTNSGTQSEKAARAVDVGQASQPTPFQIQSIRHLPMPIRSGSFVDAHTSMNDILAQQQGEKLAIKEAVAKRSLQEIQQEQEFQAWWDQESRRVQEEEARTNNLVARQERSGRGRGSGRGSRKRGSGRRGDASSAGDPDRSAPQQSKAERAPSHTVEPVTVRPGSGGDAAPPSMATSSTNRSKSTYHRRTKGKSRTTATEST